MVKVFGIKNCDSCRKALKWLKLHDVPHRFHDLRERAPSASLVGLWCNSSFGDRIVNRRSTTWRSLNGQQRAAALANPEPSLLEHPTLIKRPVFMRGSKVLAVGFYPSELESRLPGF
ncbi:MAG TPA: Spx/MgsR family RNA polymerase-binding regulatory protein [Xanthomonadales bacterium]|nr:Spx/MgsR family RNA polymerase-binding regulatory protein [Xanthomonadales bacterium]